MIRTLFVALLLISPAADVAWCQAGKKVAVLIGVNRYSNVNFSQLDFCENDVVELAKILRPQGYEVTLLSDSQPNAFQPTRENILLHLDRVLKKRDRDDLVIFGFAGHGLEFEGDKANYFLPRDAEPNDSTTMISLKTIYEKLDDCGAGVKLMFVDACRNKVKKARFRTGFDGDATPPPPKGVCALFSCAAGQSAQELADLQHGLFFYHLLNGLRGKAKNADDEVTVLGLADYATRNVNKAGLKQTPVFRGEVSNGTLVRLDSVPAETAKILKAGDTMTNTIGMKLAYIPPGKFTMGAAKEEQSRAAEDLAISEKKSPHPDSGKIYAVIVLDNNNPSPFFNKEASDDGNKIRDMLASLSYADLGPTSFISRSRVTKNEILDEIKSIPAGPKDTLFVYYSGFGSFDANVGKGHYFDLTLKGADGTNRLYRKEVLEAMKSRKCSLTVLITDARCKDEKHLNQEKIAEVIAEVAPRPKLRFDQERLINADILSELLLKYEGLVDVNSCSPKQVAFAGFFTPTLVDTCQTWWGSTSGDPDLWDSFFQKVKKQTSAVAEEIAKKVDDDHELAKQKTQTPMAFYDLKTSVRRRTDSIDHEKRHEVHITKGFYFGVYEVTQDEYTQIMAQNPSKFNASGANKLDVQGLNVSRFPVEAVSWDEAKQFCRKLSEKEVKNYRLPTEAEWEYACRAGSGTAYHHGDTISEQAANVDYKLKRTAKVGLYAKNAWGLYDMHGNVSEWCEDWYEKDYYSKSSASDPAGPSHGVSRVFRGGGWYDYPSHCRSASRKGGAPSDRNGLIGFRVVLDVSP